MVCEWCELLICHHAWTIHRPDKSLLSGSVQRKHALLPLSAALAAERESRLTRFARLLARHNSELEVTDPDWPPLAEVEATLDQDYQWLGTIDFLSLIACNGWTTTFQVPDPEAMPLPAGAKSEDELRAIERRERAETKDCIEARFSKGRLILSPFPFVGTYSLSIRYRDIPIRNYETNSELAVALARAKWQTFGIRILPA